MKTKEEESGKVWPIQFCSHCGARLRDGVKFCENCGEAVPVKAAEPIDKDTGTERKTERSYIYEGVVHKCPNCGEVLGSFELNCPACGYEINSTELNETIKDFVETVSRYDQMIANIPQKKQSRKGWKTWGKTTRILWVILNIFLSCIPLVVYLVWPLIKILFRRKAVPELSPIEQKKVALIKNFIFPNNRESLLEALLFIKSQTAFIASQKVTEKNIFWLETWKTKASQLYQKADLLKNDAIAKTAYDDILANAKKVDEKIYIRSGIGSAVIITFTIVIISVGSLPMVIMKIIPANMFSNDEKSAVDNNFEWLKTGLSTKVPPLESLHGQVINNSDTELLLRFRAISYNDFEEYISACKEQGYTVDAKKDTDTYKAYDQNGYLLEITYWSDDDLDVELKAPLLGDDNFEWPSHKFAFLIPEFKGKKGTIETETADTLEFMLCDISVSEFQDYIIRCENAGFTIDEEKEDTSFEGFNAVGYKLSISYNEMKAMNVSIKAPVEFGNFEWPSSGPATMLPKPPSKNGKITIDYDWAFSISVSDMTLEEFNSYIEACLAEGFEKSLRTERYFSADKGREISLRVEYVGFNTVEIDIHDLDRF